MPNISSDEALRVRFWAWRQRAEIFFAIQNGTSIRKWRKQLRRISWIKFLVWVTLKRIFVQRRPACLGCGLRKRSTFMVSVNRWYCEKTGDTSAVALCEDVFFVASPGCARFWRRCTPDLKRSLELKHSPRRLCVMLKVENDYGWDKTWRHLGKENIFFVVYIVETVTQPLWKGQQQHKASLCWVAF